jgi:hypothetical protein
MNAKDIAAKLDAETTSAAIEKRRAEAQIMLDTFMAMLTLTGADQGAAFCAHGTMVAHLAAFSSNMDEEAFVSTMRETFRLARSRKP